MKKPNLGGTLVSLMSLARKAKIVLEFKDFQNDLSKKIPFLMPSRPTYPYNYHRLQDA